MLSRIRRGLRPFSAASAIEQGTPEPADTSGLQAATVGGFTVFLRPGTPDLAVASACFGGEFRSLAHAYDRDVRGLIIDAGGYIGTAAMALSSMYPKATVVSVEPSTANFAVLAVNTRDWPNIHCEKAALSPQASGSATLRDRGTGQWGYTLVEKPEDHPVTVLETVAVTSFEKLLAKYGFDDVLMLKMDIEGSERQFFEEPAWLKKTRILAVELHDRIIAGCEAAFHRANTGRYVYRPDGEKFISVGAGYFGQPAG